MSHCGSVLTAVGSHINATKICTKRNQFSVTARGVAHANLRQKKAFVFSVHSGSQPSELGAKK